MATITTDQAQDRILSTLTLGFSADPIMRWLFPQADTYLKYFPEALKLFGGAAFDNNTALNADTVLPQLFGCHPILTQMATDL